MEKRIKHYNQHNAEVEKAEVEKKYLPLMQEYLLILKKLEVESLAELEFKLNEKSGFVNAMMSATAYGLEPEYKRLIELEKALDGKLSKDDITANGSVKKSVLDEITERYTIYYSEDELKTKKALEDIMALYNNLSFEDRRQVVITRDGLLSYNLFSPLKN